MSTQRIHLSEAIRDRIDSFLTGGKSKEPVQIIETDSEIKRLRAKLKQAMEREFKLLDRITQRDDDLSHVRKEWEALFVALDEMVHRIDKLCSGCTTQPSLETEKVVELLKKMDDEDHSREG